MDVCLYLGRKVKQNRKWTEEEAGSTTREENENETESEKTSNSMATNKSWKVASNHRHFSRRVRTFSFAPTLILQLRELVLKERDTCSRLLIRTPITRLRAKHSGWKGGAWTCHWPDQSHRRRRLPDWSSSMPDRGSNESLRGRESKG